MPYTISGKSKRKVYIGHFPSNHQRKNPGLIPRLINNTYAPIQVRQSYNTDKIGPLSQENKTAIVENSLPQDQFKPKPEYSTPPQPTEETIDKSPPLENTKVIEKPSPNLPEDPQILDSSGGSTHTTFTPKPLTRAELNQIENTYKKAKRARKTKPKHSFNIQ